MTFELEIVSIGDADASPAILHELERAHYERLRIHKQRREHLAGRLAAKRALAKLTGLELARFAIVRSGGPPEVFVDGVRATDLWISISHDPDLAIGAAARVPIGVDIERVEPREASFEELIASKEERATFAALHGSDRDRAVTLLWCTKEALAKQRGKGFEIAFVDLLGTMPATRSLIVHEGVEHAVVVVC